ncbi:MAG TPA: hypothetical protein VF017_04555 [Thermoanaerobaculia bacterium]|nr:hypothetical protein [Thermoanaerobaculia bacterium]
MGRPSCRGASALLLLLAAMACARPGDAPSPAPPPPPIVLITIEGLRRDVVGGLGGEPGWTPNLDRLVHDANWAGTAITPSSSLVPSLVSVLTGLRPWQHQMVSPGQRQLEAGLVPLAERLAALGYEARGYTDSVQLGAGHGWARGLKSYTALRRGNQAAADIASLADRRAFLWIHLTTPGAPYVRKPWMVAQLRPGDPPLPRRVDPARLEPYFDPAVDLPPALRDELKAMYRLNVIAADAMVGRLLQGLDKGPAAERALVVVTSVFGQEFGEHGQIAAGGNLGRYGIEVPLLVRLPRGLDGGIRLPRDQPVSLTRVFATLVEAAGGEVAPEVAPSLFRSVTTPLLSELYLAAGANEFSLVEGNAQLRWLARFADPRPGFYALRLEALRSEKDSPAREAFRRTMAELTGQWRQSPPLSGRVTPPEAWLERWTEGGVERFDDPDRARQMSARLRLAWGRFVGSERTPEQEAASRRP